MESIAPAMKEASSSSTPKRAASAERPISSSTAPRTRIWAVVSWSRTSARDSQAIRSARRMVRPRSATERMNPSSSATLTPGDPASREKKSESRMTAPKSASEAPAITCWPKPLSLWPASFRTGTTRPSEVARSVMAMKRGALTRPAGTTAKPTPTPIASEARNPAPASLSAGPLSRSKSISRPARKSRKARPRVDSTWIGRSTCTQCSTGPRRMPAAISSTTAGTRSRGARPSRSGARKATAATATSCVEELTCASSLRRSGPHRHRPRRPEDGRVARVVEELGGERAEARAQKVDGARGYAGTEQRPHEVDPDRPVARAEHGRPRAAGGFEAGPGEERTLPHQQCDDEPDRERRPAHQPGPAHEEKDGEHQEGGHERLYRDRLPGQHAAPRRRHAAHHTVGLGAPGEPPDADPDQGAGELGRQVAGQVVGMNLPGQPEGDRHGGGGVSPAEAGPRRDCDQAPCGGEERACQEQPRGDRGYGGGYRRAAAEVEGDRAQAAEHQDRGAGQLGTPLGNVEAGQGGLPAPCVHVLSRRSTAIAVQPAG